MEIPYEITMKSSEIPISLGYITIFSTEIPPFSTPQWAQLLVRRLVSWGHKLGYGAPITIVIQGYFKIFQDISTL
jgi:hypothetical protein